jgi:hypothetical protein
MRFFPGPAAAAPGEAAAPVGPGGNQPAPRCRRWPEALEPAHCRRRAAAAGEQEEEEEGVQFPAASLSLPPSESLSLLSLSSWVSDSAPPSSSSRSPPPPVSLSLRRFCPLRTKCPVASRVHRVHHLLRLQRNSKT